MKRLLLVSIVFMSLCVISTSCKKDDPITNQEEVTNNGTFQLYLDDNLYTEGSDVIAATIKDNENNWTNTVTIGDDNISIMASQIPRTVGSQVTMEEDADPGISFTQNNDFYSTFSGTMTRTSASKISFEGKCRKILSTEEFNIKGYIDSDVFNVIE